MQQHDVVVHDEIVPGNHDEVVPGNLRRSQRIINQQQVPQEHRGLRIAAGGGPWAGGALTTPQRR